MPKNWHGRSTSFIFLKTSSSRWCCFSASPLKTVTPHIPLSISDFLHKIAFDFPLHSPVEASATVRYNGAMQCATGLHVLVIFIQLGASCLFKFNVVYCDGKIISSRIRSTIKLSLNFTHMHTLPAWHNRASERASALGFPTNRYNYTADVDDDDEATRCRGFNKLPRSSLLPPFHTHSRMESAGEGKKGAPAP